MEQMRGTLGRLTDRIGDAISELLGALTPEPELIPIPVRDGPRRPRQSD